MIGTTNASGGVSPGSIGTSAITDGAVTQVKLASNAVSFTYTASIPTTGWSNNSRTIAVNGLLSADTPIVDVNITSAADAESVQNAFSRIYRMVTGANSLTVYALEVPTVAIPIRLLCIRR